MEHPVQADVVIGVPDSGLDAALGYAYQSGIPYGIGFIKNKYIGRTFISPGQKNREDKVRIKLNVLRDTVRGKRVVLVDDSIVRGTTIARIISLLREGGATQIHVRSSAPPFRNPCYYGTDIDSRDNLIAHRYELDKIAGVIGADSVGYLYLPFQGRQSILNAICYQRALRVKSQTAASRASPTTVTAGHTERTSTPATHRTRRARRFSGPFM